MNGIILVVDDSAESLQLLTNILISEGYQVYSADSGKLALASLEVRLPDLILLDIRMPDMDGFEVCRMIKTREESRLIPIIFISAVTEVEDHVEGFRLGAVDFITKPFYREELMSRVRTHIELNRLRVQLEHQLAMRTEEVAKLKLTDEALRKSEERLQEAQAMAHVGSFSYNFAMDTIWWSDEVYRLFCIEPIGSPLRLQDVKRMIHPGDIDCLRSYARRLIDSGGTIVMDYRIVRPDGTVGHHYMQSRVVLSPEGQPLEIIGTLQDITERKQAEEALQRSQAAMLARTESMAHVGSWEWDVAADSVTWSDELFRIFRMKQAEGAPSFTEQAKLYHPEDMAMLRAAVEKAVNNGIPYEIELRAFRMDGETRLCLARGYAEMGPDGRAGRLFGSLQDITERKLVEEQLYRANEIAELAQKAVGAGIWDWDILTGHLEWSAELFSLLGLKPSEHRASFEIWRSVLHPADRAKAEELIQWSVRDRTMLDSRYRIIRPDGRERWINALGKTTYDETGQPLRMTGICMDITERKRAEENLRESEERLKDAQAMAHVGSFSVNLTTDTVWWSDEVYRLFGVEPIGSPLRLQDVERMIHPEDFEHWQSSTRRAIDAGGSVATENRIIRPDGTIRHHYVLSRVVLSPEGQPLEIVGTVQDITERKEAEDALKKSQRLLAETGMVGKVGGWEFNIDTAKQVWTEETYKIHEVDLTYEPTVEKGINFYTPASREIMKPAAQRAVEHDEPFDLELEIITARGNLRSVHVIGKPDLEHRRVYGFFQDITVQKMAEKEQKKLQDQLAQAQKMESIGRLAGGVAHNFNNILGIILGCVEVTMDEIEPANPIFPNLEIIRRATERSANLTRQLLAFARRQTAAPRVLDLNKTVEGMLKILQQLIGEDIDMSWKPAQYLYPVKMDPVQIDQLLANLLVNARDAITGVGKINIETAPSVFDEVYCALHTGFKPGEYVRLSVRDNGCGMDRETLANIFEPFFTTKELYRGTGLGLATVYGIVSQNNGFIKVYSEPGKGTAFNIYLPRYTGDTGVTSEKETVETISGGGETVLLVEDELMLLELTKTILKKLGYTVLTAVTPGEALSLAGKHKDEIHLLITDVVMPEMNGSDLARELLLIYPNLKCLFMSGYPVEHITHHGILDEGMNFIKKPFYKKDLAVRVRELLE